MWGRAGAHLLHLGCRDPGEPLCVPEAVRGTLPVSPTGGPGSLLKSKCTNVSSEPHEQPVRVTGTVPSGQVGHWNQTPWLFETSTSNTFEQFSFHPLNPTTCISLGFCHPCYGPCSITGLCRGRTNHTTCRDAQDTPGCRSSGSRSTSGSSGVPECSALLALGISTLPRHHASGFSFLPPG